MINLMNYYEHPGDNRYYIFEFRSVEQSMNFEHLLEEYSVEFEKLVEDEQNELLVNDGWKVMYAISKSDFEAGLRANNLTSAKFRSPIIGNVYVRYAFVILMMSLIGLAILGYYRSN